MKVIATTDSGTGSYRQTKETQHGTQVSTAEIRNYLRNNNSLSRCTQHCSKTSQSIRHSSRRSNHHHQQQLSGRDLQEPEDSNEQ